MNPLGGFEEDRKVSETKGSSRYSFLAPHCVTDGAGRPFILASLGQTACYILVKKGKWKAHPQTGRDQLGVL